MKRSGAKQEGESASQLISQRIAELGDWRGETLAYVRAGDVRLVVRLQGMHELAKGQGLELGVGAVHFFDTDGSAV